jgi:thioredoxin 1
MISYPRQLTKAMLFMLAAILSSAPSLALGVVAKAETSEGERVLGDHLVEELPVGDITPDELLSAYPSFRGGYEAFAVETLYLPGDVSVLMFFGTWCHDSEREVPRLLKLLEAAGLSENNLSLIALDYRKREPKGRAVKFNVRYTPTAIFMREGVEVGRIIERPNISLHEDIKAMFAKDD